MHFSEQGFHTTTLSWVLMSFFVVYNFFWIILEIKWRHDTMTSFIRLGPCENFHPKVKIVGKSRKASCFEHSFQDVRIWDGDNVSRNWEWGRRVGLRWCRRHKVSDREKVNDGTRRFGGSVSRGQMLPRGNWRPEGEREVRQRWRHFDYSMT